jgi:hypothetical protein
VFGVSLAREFFGHGSEDRVERIGGGEELK